ncbi:MAG: CHAD domain-containing protein [Pelolinea sp.]|nr:CHAD domain-containing protein [Pelolinea sp.]
MTDKKDDIHIIQYCARSLLPNIQTLKKSSVKILKRSNIDDIHDLRVASRRIRTILDVFSDQLPNKKVKNWEKEISTITKSFGLVRDLDVQIDLINKIYKSTEESRLRSGLRRVRLRLNQKRQQKQADTSEANKLILNSAPIAEMEHWAETVNDRIDEDLVFSTDLFRVGYKKIQSRLDEFLFYEVFIFDPTRISELHQMRIKAKRLRYALEVFSDLYHKETDFALEISKQVQEYLGNIHDCDVWINFLPNFLHKELHRINTFYGYSSPFNRIKPGIEYLIKDREKERTRLYKSFINEWKKWKFDEIWLNLRKVVLLTSLETPHPPNDKEINEKTEASPIEPISDKTEE